MRKKLVNEKKKSYIIFFFLVTLTILPNMWILGERIYINLVGKDIKGYIESYDTEYIEHKDEETGDVSYTIKYVPLIVMKNEDEYIRLKSNYNANEDLIFKEGEIVNMKYINNDLKTAIIADPFYLYSDIATVTSIYTFLGIFSAINVWRERRDRSKFFKLSLNEKGYILLLLIPGFISSMAVIAMRERFNNNGEYGIKIQLFFIILYLFLISSTFIDFFKSKIKKKYL